MATERMFNFGGSFRYAECAQCKSLWLLDVPEDLGPYYPDTYYSIAEFNKPQTPYRRFVLSMWGLHRYLQFHTLMRRIGVLPQKDAALLDVGCGGGVLLRGLRLAGYRNLSGVDPHVRASSDSNGIRIVKGEIRDLNERYDLIMFHHSLEHVVDVEGNLRAARALLKQGGRILVRAPTPAYAWRKYRDRWVGIDAPRHLWLFTPTGFEAQAARCGLRLDHTVFDSASQQFWASEAYMRDLSYQDVAARGPFEFVLVGGFRALRYRKRVRELNARGDGDSVAFVLSAASPSAAAG